MRQKFYLFAALLLGSLVICNAFATNINVTLSATGEEQQVNQAGLIFNNAIPGQAFPSVPNYFSSTRVTAGRRIRYTVSVENLEAAVSSNVTLNIVLPVMISVYQGSLTAPAGVNCAALTPDDPNGDLFCDLGSIPASGTRTISLQVVVAAETSPGTVLMSGAAVATSGDSDLSNNVAVVSSTVLGASDLTVGLATVGTQLNYVPEQGRFVETAVSNAVSSGNILRHRVEVQNNGPSDALTALIKHVLPAGFIFTRSEGARCIPGATESNLIFCALDKLEGGTRAAYDLYVSVDPFIATSSPLDSCVEALGSSSNTIPPGPPPLLVFDPPLQPLSWDPRTTDNSSCRSVAVNSAMDLGVSFKESYVSVDSGGTVNYRPIVQNEGSSGLLGASLTVTFPVGLKLLSASSGCTVNGGSATCAVLPLSPSESQEFDVAGSVELKSSAVSSLAVGAVLGGITPADTNGTNNTASAITLVKPLSDTAAITMSARSFDFDIDRGTWGVNSRGDFFSFELGTARALVKPAKLSSFSSGKLQTAVRLLRYKDSTPNGSIIFAHHATKNYRYVRLEKRGSRGQVLIGQSADFDGEKRGLKARASYRLKLSRVYNIAVEVDADGLVDVRINNSGKSVVAYRFTKGAHTGQVGLETRKARAVYGPLSVQRSS
jgi:uncharacterized repeat protein (TIGR01451 family)